MKSIQIGRLLRAGTTGFIVGCRVNQLEAPAFGALVRVPLEPAYQIFGLIHDIRIDDDGLVRQLVTAEGIDEAIIADNRVNRNVPVEMSVLAVGYQEGETIRHLLPPMRICVPSSHRHSTRWQLPCAGQGTRRCSRCGSERSMVAARRSSRFLSCNISNGQAT